MNRDIVQIRARTLCAALWLSLLGSLPLVTGCGGGVHSVWILSPQAEARLLAATNYPACTGKVFLTEGGLAANQTTEDVAKLDVGTVSEEPTEAVLVMLADKAREVGANAVIHVKVWRQGSGFTWKAPHGSGLAVHVADINALAGLNGCWR